MNNDTFSLEQLSAPHKRIRWSPDTEDLHMNVVDLRAGEQIEKHVNAALDVIVTCLCGTGSLTIDDDVHPLIPGTIVMIRHGAHRTIEAGDDGIVYTTVHRKRGGIIPEVRQR